MRVAGDFGARFSFRRPISNCPVTRGTPLIYLGNLEGGKSKKTNAEFLLHPIKRAKNEKTSKRKNKSSVYPPAALSRARRFLVYRSGAEALERRSGRSRRRFSAGRAEKDAVNLCGI